MAESSNEGIHILMLGRTGNGKSSTGNSILGEKKFTPKSSTSSAIIYEVKAATKEINGVPVMVVEGPGLGDTDIDVTDDGQSMIGLSEKALSLISYKLHALLVVLKYGSRFTNQEKEAVKMIKAIFGEDIIKNYGIIVMTYGDNFALDMEGEDITFAEWCDQQTGAVRILFDECDKRCALFDNRSKDGTKIKKQREQLLNLVSGIIKHRSPYSRDDFIQAKPCQNTLIVKGKLPELKSKTEDILSNIHERIAEIKESDPLERMKELQRLSHELEAHKEFLNTEDMETGLIGQLLISMSITETWITTLMSIQNLKKMTTDLAESKQQQNEVNITSGDQRVVKDKKGRNWISYFSTILKFLSPLACIYVWWSVRKLSEWHVSQMAFGVFMC